MISKNYKKIAIIDNRYTFMRPADPAPGGYVTTEIPINLDFTPSRIIMYYYDSNQTCVMDSKYHHGDGYANSGFGAGTWGYIVKISKEKIIAKFNHNRYHEVYTKEIIAIE